MRDFFAFLGALCRLVISFRGILPHSSPPPSFPLSLSPSLSLSFSISHSPSCISLFILLSLSFLCAQNASPVFQRMIIPPFLFPASPHFPLFPFLLSPHHRSYSPSLHPMTQTLTSPPLLRVLLRLLQLLLLLLRLPSLSLRPRQLIQRVREKGRGRKGRNGRREGEGEGKKEGGLLRL